MSRQFDRLERVEINLLKHLSRFSPFGTPIIVPLKFKPAFLRLWRLGLIDIWYRQDRDHPNGRPSQFISITVDGLRRIETIVRGGKFPRLGDFQGQETVGDQSSESKQD